MEGVSIVPIVATASISTAVGLIAAALWGVLRKKAVAHVKISSPEQRQITRLESRVQLHDFLIQAGADRSALQARATIMLADAVKSNDQEKADKALDLISAGERQYAASLSARIMRGEVEDAESAEEAS